MSQNMGRLACPSCGANNFSTVTQCWKCGAALGASRAVTGQAVPGQGPQGPSGPVLWPTQANSGSSATALRSAVLLGLLMPCFGLPIGLAFMMMEDRKRQDVGRVCVMWSVISLVLHTILMFVSAIGMREAAMALLGSAKGASGLGGGGGGLGTYPGLP